MESGKIVRWKCALTEMIALSIEVKSILPLCEINIRGIHSMHGEASGSIRATGSRSIQLSQSCFAQADFLRNDLKLGPSLEIENSSWCNELCGDSEVKQNLNPARHFVIVGQDFVVQLLCAEEPIVKLSFSK
jgi:hypothetical protein